MDLMRNCAISIERNYLYGPRRCQYLSPTVGLAVSAYSDGTGTLMKAIRMHRCSSGGDGLALRLTLDSVQRISIPATYECDRISQLCCVFEVIVRVTASIKYRVRIVNIEIRSNAERGSRKTKHGRNVKTKRIDKT